MIKTRSFTIVIVLGFLASILFSAMFSFAEEKLTFTAYYPSPNGYYNQLNATDLTVMNDARVGNHLRLGMTNDYNVDISVVSPSDPAELVLQGAPGSNDAYARVVLASNTVPNDPNAWLIDQSAQSGNENKLIYRYHATSSGSSPEMLTLDTQGNMGIGTTHPSTKLYINDTRRDLIHLESSNEAGTGIMFQNTHADMGANQYFGMGWGGSTANDRRDKLNFWYGGDNTNYVTPPIMTLHNNGNITIPNGRMTIGYDTVGSHGLQVNRNFSQENHAFGILARTTQTPIGNGSYTVAGLKTEANGYLSSGDNTGSLISIHGQAFLKSSGTINNLYGANIEVGHSGAGATGTITDLHGVHIRAHKAAAGTVANTHLLHLYPIPNTIPNNRYAIYQAGTNDENYFAGNVNITGDVMVDGTVQGLKVLGAGRVNMSGTCSSSADSCVICKTISFQSWPNDKIIPIGILTYPGSSGTWGHWAIKFNTFNGPSGTIRVCIDANEGLAPGASIGAEWVSYVIYGAD